LARLTQRESRPPPLPQPVGTGTPFATSCHSGEGHCARLRLLLLAPGLRRTPTLLVLDIAWDWRARNRFADTQGERDHGAAAKPGDKHRKHSRRVPRCFGYPTPPVREVVTTLIGVRALREVRLDQDPNQRSRRADANATLSAASSREGPTSRAVGAGPPKKLASTFPTIPPPNSM
jgi:hypothetical protein